MTAGPSRVLDPGRELIAQFLRIFRRKVDLIGDAVDAEFDGLIGSFAVGVVDQCLRDLFRHQGRSENFHSALVDRQNVALDVITFCGGANAGD
jgi:hypothetical protein